MGVRGLLTFLRKQYPDLLQTQKLSDFTNQSIIIDGSFLMYFFLTSPGADKLTDKQGCRTMPINGTLLVLIQLKRWGITPYIVFDGPSPIFKQDEKARRAITRTVTPTQHEWRSFKRFLTAAQVQYYNAAGEADPLCAALESIGRSVGVFTSDSDLLPFGVRTLILSLEFRRLEAITVSLDDVLRVTGLNRAEFIDFCLLCGTDYDNKPVINPNPSKAFKLIQEYRSIDRMNQLDIAKHKSHLAPGFTTLYPTLQKYYMQPVATDLTYTDINYQWNWDVVSLIDYLVDKHDFSRDRLLRIFMTTTK
jgi:flap endonuclease-1